MAFEVIWAPDRRASRLSRKPRPTPDSRRVGRRPRTTPTAVALAEIKDDLSKYLRLAVDEEIVITRHGRPAGILIGFESEDDWFEYRLEHHPEFLRRIAAARAAFQQGLGVPLPEVK